MTKTLNQTPSTNDILLDPSTGDLAIASGKEAYAVIVADIVRSVKGELQYDKESGMPYFSTVFKTVSAMPVWRSEVLGRIERLPFVTSVVDFSMSFDSTTKTLSYTLELATDEGNITVTQKGE